MRSKILGSAIKLKRHMSLPPGPQGPAWLIQLQLLLWPIQSLQRWSETYGDIFTLKGVSSSSTIAFGRPDAIKAILTANPDVYVERRVTQMLRIFIGNQSTPALEGKEHRRDRKLFSSLFREKTIIDSVNRILGTAERAMDAWKPGMTFTSRSFTQEVTLNIMLDLIFGSILDDDIQRIKGKLIDGVSLMNRRWLTIVFLFLPRWSLPMISPWNRLVSARRQLEEVIVKVTADRIALMQENHIQENILNSLIMDMEDNLCHSSIERLLDRVVTLLVAGHETTASSLAWAFALIYSHPNILKALRKELDSVHEGNPASILELPYLSAVCNETLRLYAPIVEVPRVLRQPMTIQDYHFPAGTRLMPCMPLTHKRADLYTDPLSFNPERFLARDYSPYEFWPFGEGSRKCLGMSLALIEMKLVIATVVRSWDLAAPDLKSAMPQRRGVLVGPPDSIRLRVLNRRCLPKEQLP